MIYAEALYKMNGTLTQTEIDETINRLRDRVGMHRMDLKELQQWNLDLWTEIKRERRIELSFDGMRYADIMRWREFGDVIYEKSRAEGGPRYLIRLCIICGLCLMRKE